MHATNMFPCVHVMILVACQGTRADSVLHAAFDACSVLTVMHVALALGVHFESIGERSAKVSTKAYRYLYAFEP